MHFMNARKKDTEVSWFFWRDKMAACTDFLLSLSEFLVSQKTFSELAMFFLMLFVYIIVKVNMLHSVRDEQSQEV